MIVSFWAVEAGFKDRRITADFCCRQVWRPQISSVALNFSLILLTIGTFIKTVSQVRKNQHNWWAETFIEISWGRCKWNIVSKFLRILFKFDWNIYWENTQFLKQVWLLEKSAHQQPICRQKTFVWLMYNFVWWNEE